MDSVLQAAQLRALGKQGEALDYVAEKLVTSADDERFLLMLQGLYAAEEVADTDQPQRFARELAEIEPNLISVQPYVALSPEDFLGPDMGLARK